MSAVASPPREGIESPSAFQVATKVTIYAQCHSLNDYETMRRDPGHHASFNPTESTMTTISKDADLITLINVFTVDPSNQSRLVELLTRATDTFVRHARGFISSSLHRSRDGNKVTMYAQWRSLDDYEAMRRDPGPVPYLQEALTIATFEPGIYDVVESFAPPAA